MASYSRSNSPPLRGLRGTRRVWSSDEEEDETPIPLITQPLASGCYGPSVALSAKITQGTAMGSATTVMTPSMQFSPSVAQGVGRQAVNAVSPEEEEELFAGPTEKTKEEEELIISALKKNKNLSSFVAMDDDRIRQMQERQKSHC